MKIQKITTEIKKIPLRTAFITALRRVENVEFIRVSVVCEDGVQSYGEAPATKAITGEDLGSIKEAIDSSKTLFYGHSPLDALKILHQQSFGSSAKAALDMAFYALENSDIRAKVKPLNGVKRTQTKTAITISLNEKSKMLYDARDALYNGHHILKLKFGADIHHAIAVTRYIYEELPRATILVDANQAWSVEDAKVYLDALDSTKIALLEQPLIAQDIKGLKELKEYSEVAIVADESCFTLEDVQAVVESKSADIINIKFMKCGGMTKAIEILEYCKEKKTPVMFGSMLEGPISIGYACYLVDKYSDIVEYVDLDSPLLYR